MLKHHLIRRAAVTVAAAAALALPVAATTAASAAPAAPAVVPHSLHFGKSGVAGYELTTNTPTNHLTAVLVPGTTIANIGGLGVGGTGGQFCNPNNNYAAQLGETSDGTHLDVVYQAGTLGGCEDNGVLQSPLQVNAALTGLPLTDNVQIWMSHYNVRVKIGKRPHRHYVTRTKILFQAQDVTTGSDVYSKTITAPGKEYFDSVGFGIQQLTAGMSACATPNSNVYGIPHTQDGTCNTVVTITHPFVSGVSFFELSTNPLQEWVTSAGGNPANVVLVGPGAPSLGGFALYTGNATI